MRRDGEAGCRRRGRSRWQRRSGVASRTRVGRFVVVDLCLGAVPAASVCAGGVEYPSTNSLAPTVAALGAQSSSAPFSAVRVSFASPLSNGVGPFLVGGPVHQAGDREEEGGGTITADQLGFSPDPVAVPARRGRGRERAPRGSRSRGPCSPRRRQGRGAWSKRGSSSASPCARRPLKRLRRSERSPPRGKSRGRRRRHLQLGSPLGQALGTALLRRESGLSRARARTLPRMANAQRTPVVPLEAGAGPENPPCPACGEPLFGWLAAQARPGRPGQPLRELRPRRRRCSGRARGGAARARPARAPRRPRIANRGSYAARSAAPAGPAWSQAPATSSRSSRCGGWSPAATRW